MLRRGRRRGLHDSGKWGSKEGEQGDSEDSEIGGGRHFYMTKRSIFCC